MTPLNLTTAFYVLMLGWASKNAHYIENMEFQGLQTATAHFLTFYDILITVSDRLDTLSSLQYPLFYPFL